jgi:hypothetical protein
MKWLATILCLLSISVSAQELPIMPEAQDPESQVITLPMQVQCVTVAPDKMLDEMYSESVFLWGEGSIFIPGGDTVNGKMRFFASPDEKTFTVVLEVGELSCLVISGSLKAMFEPELKL